MSQEEKVHECKKHKEARCRKYARELDEYDPRSYCHNICATPENICKQAVCEEFIDEGPLEERRVCIPRRICKVNRYFGPETYSEDEKKSVPTGESEASDDEDDKKLTQKKQQDMKDKLETLKQTLNPEDMAAVYALAGNDICPCCGCRICECEIRRKNEESIEKEKKKKMSYVEESYQRRDTKPVAGIPTARKSLKKEYSIEETDSSERIPSDENVQIGETIPPPSSRSRQTASISGQSASISGTPAPISEASASISGQRASISGTAASTSGQLASISEDVDETDETVQMKNEDEEEDIPQRGYGYSFDYFSQPDLEAFEKLKKLKQEEEMKEEIKKKIIAEQKQQKKKKKASGAGVEVTSLAEPAEVEVQASPETQEKQSQFYGKEQKEDLIDEYSKVTPITDKIDEWKEQSVDDTGWAEYKETEWAGRKNQEKRTVIEEKALEIVEEALKKETVPLSDATQASHTQRTSKIPQLDERPHPFDQTWLDDREKKSLIPSRTSSLKHVAGAPRSPPTAAETIAHEMETIKSAEESVHSEIESDEIFFASAADYDEYFSKRQKEYLTDICDCLPGLCTCGKQHYIFKKERETEDFAMGFKTQQADKMTPLSPEDKIRPKKSFGELSNKSSCSCIHPLEETQVTPVVSRIEVVASPPPQFFEPQIGKRSKSLVKCVEPRYQKTLVIVKPEAVRYKDVIFRAIHQEGLDIVNERLVQLTPEQVAEIYSENFGSAYFPLFVQQLSSSPVLAVTIAGNNAIQRWNAVVGPGKGIPVSWFYPASMRRRFCVNEDINDVMKLSDDFQKAKTEIRYFFPFNIIDPIIISSTMIQDYCDEFIHPTLLKGLFKLVQSKPADPIGFLAEWLLINNPFQPFYKQKEVSLAPT